MDADISETTTLPCDGPLKPASDATVAPKRPRPPRPPRPHGSPPDSIGDASDVITFDVGGILFPCKLHVLEKFPNARLHRVALCGCSSTSANNVFLDRNPSLFSILLEWYKTGHVRLPGHIARDVMEAEAHYFDVGTEMFPVPKHTVVCFAKALQSTLLPHQPPIVFVLRAHEQLVLESAAGPGRLLLRVTDLSGATTVHQAVLYDSDSYFFLAVDPPSFTARRNLIYSFWVEPTRATTPIVVEFKLRYLFAATDQVVLSSDDQIALHESMSGFDAESHVVTAKTMQSLHAPRLVHEKTAVDTLEAPLPTKTPGANLPEKTKERAQIVEETQLFQAKLREHAVWVQLHQRELAQQQHFALKEDGSPRRASSEAPAGYVRKPPTKKLA
ncbi:hypothetical protein SPRG_13296 [Saprolegnia parasitica CBS 223.65]|uniref:Potassium channel tetramerisation-type BTB domain-containing protein n=1 Tax=Saprolegnia parasitica (strain CBS 223.65) TaxID=695850 RepID=A0A067C4Y8_SAPPC|nr:hypothetical protein SPRG_13296 [Saprolegnia parasitica CBS 223.65]KDO21611.1 hypothetical protein SPRG_13296 [Saprolegnia parasitica CBS 223.65]|eukprot:XP_012207697.1 hypothetical protein SPRG_13296 [Saprolegnia parasitica CBS 223.65]